MEDKNTSVQGTINKFEKIHDKINFKVFGKVSINKKNTKEKEYTKNEDITNSKEVYEEQVKTVQTELEKIKETKNGKACQIGKRRVMVIVGEKNKI